MGVKLLEHAMKILKKVLEKVPSNDRCSFHSEEVTRGVLRQGEEVVYVLR